MSDHALEVLEFGRVLERISARASSEPGRRRIQLLRPRADRDGVVRELGRVEALMRFVDEAPEWGMPPIPDADGALARLAIEGAVLDPGELYRIGVLLGSSRRVASELDARQGRYPELEATRARLLERRSLEEAVERTVDGEGQVLDSVSRELQQIRGRLRGAHSRIVRRLESYLGSLPERFVVPDGSITLREGRYVIPVRREGKREVGGIVHDESQTGATLYVEPPVAIELMNQLRDLEREEAREIRRVLGELSARLRPEREACRGALDALADFDALHTRARVALAWRASVPEIVEPGGELRIRDGRHPLLLEADAEGVVPFDLELGPAERAMVVSGPNTGGKSVFLKATGLIAALAQSGIVPPVGKGTRLPVFASFFADIGDEQSIARSLSTFSAHLANLSDIVSDAGPGSLVLIDEMGTGTDPAEGAALSRAVLEELVARGARTLVSSHLGDLKRLDAEGSGIVNASLQFDGERMQPTYRLVQGRPGQSYGLAIARRLGFPAPVLDRAETYRESDESRMEELLAKLEKREREVDEELATLQAERTRAERLRSDLEARERALSEAERTAGGRARESARRMLLEARAEVEAAVRTVREAAGEDRDVDEAAREARRRVERAAERQRRAAGRAGGARPRAGHAGPGDRVRLHATGAKGRVLEVRADRAVVEAGAMKLEVPVADLEVLDPLPGEEAAGGVARRAGHGGGGRDLGRRAVGSGLGDGHDDPVGVRDPGGGGGGLPVGDPDAVRGGRARPAEDHPDAVGGSRARAGGRPGGWSGPPVSDVRCEVDLRGKRVHELEVELVRALDDAVREDLAELRIIHGKGTGALRQRVAEMLADDARVRGMRMGGPTEGGAGVTVVSFRGEP
jgi:DNA mismatch repair protein MutS2